MKCNKQFLPAIYKKAPIKTVMVVLLATIAALVGVNCLRSENSEASPAKAEEPAGLPRYTVASVVQAPGWGRMNLPRIGDVWKLNAVVFSSPREGWAVGSDEDSTKGVVLHYLNGVWEKDFMPFVSKVWTVHLMDIALSGPRDGWVVGDKYYIWSDPDRFKGYLLRLQNGKWRTYTPPNAGRSFNFEGVAVVPGSSETWAVGGVTSKKTRKGLLMRYSGGWRQVTGPDVGADWWELHDVCFPSPNRGWAVGKVVHPDAKDNPLLVISYKNGRWTREDTPVAHGLKRSLLAVDFPTPETGWAAGEGALLKYANGGWERDQINGDVDNWIIRSISFSTPDDGWAIGWDDAGKKPLWLHRNSRGWRRVATRWDDKLQEFRGIFFLKPDLGWATGGISWRGAYPGAVFKYTPKINN